MRCDVQHLRAARVGVLRQQKNVDLLDDPRRRRFEIIQKDIRDGFVRQAGRLAAEKPAAQKREGQAVGAVHFFQRRVYARCLRRRAAQTAQQQRRGGADGQLLCAGGRLGEMKKGLQLCCGTPLQRERREGIEKLKDR